MLSARPAPRNRNAQATAPKPADPSQAHLFKPRALLIGPAVFHVVDARLQRWIWRAGRHNTDFHRQGGRAISLRGLSERCRHLGLIPPRKHAEHPLPPKSHRQCRKSNRHLEAWIALVAAASSKARIALPMTSPMRRRARTAASLNSACSLSMLAFSICSRLSSKAPPRNNKQKTKRELLGEALADPIQPQPAAMHVAEAPASPKLSREPEPCALQVQNKGCAKLNSKLGAKSCELAGRTAGLKHGRRCGRTPAQRKSCRNTIEHPTRARELMQQPSRE